MNNENKLRIIDPCLVAEKLYAVRNGILSGIESEILTDKRLPDAMWIFQWASIPENYAGGLSRFTTDFIDDCSEMIGPLSLVEKGKRKLSEKELAAILADIPNEDELFPDPVFDQWYSLALRDLEYDDSLSEDTLNQQKAMRIQRLTFLDFTTLQAPCIEAAREGLANYFFEVCTDLDTHFINGITKSNAKRERMHTLNWNLNTNQNANHRLWFWPDVWNCFFDWMGRRAEKIRASIAETSVTKEVFRWLDLARKTQSGVMVVGNSRFGKTEAIRCWAAMYPGRARIIETPASSAEGDLLREIARSLGIQYSSNSTKFHEIRTAIDSVIRQSNVMLVFDESQFLFPSNAGRRSDPPRLNYVRRAIMDVPCATAFICTPQSWKRVEKNYLKVTGYTIEQFEGRLLRSAVILPDELLREEMIAVARIHFPDLSDDHLDYIVSHVRAFQGSVLSCIENIARLSRIYAEESGRKSLKLSDIKQAISDCIPSRPRPDQTQKEVEAAASIGAAGREQETQEDPFFEQQNGTPRGSLLRLEGLPSGQKNRIEDPALVLAD